MGQEGLGGVSGGENMNKIHSMTFLKIKKI